MSRSLRAQLEKKEQAGVGINRTVAASAELLKQGDALIAGAAKDAKNLRLDEIEPDPDQPRRYFDPKDLQELADDIALRGILQPILVHPPTDENEKYRIIAGERRWRAAVKAGKVRIPVLIRTMSDQERRSAQLVENIIRRDLSDLEKGRALRALYDIRKAENPKSTWEDVAAEVGLKRARINDLYNLSLLPDSVAELVQCGRLTGSHAIALQRVQEKLGEQAITKLAEQAARPEDALATSYGMTVSELRRIIQERVAPSQEAVPASSADAQEEVDISAEADHSQDQVTINHTQAVDMSFVEKTLEALRSNQLPQSYRDQLLNLLHGGQRA